MAGPGGGPPRRSHTKSRKGCEQCKKRHIRCDETFPQCLNCTKHRSRCPYNDISETRSTTPDKPDLMWTPEIEAVIAEWQQTGRFPFPEMGVSPAPRADEYSVEELRLIHHVASIYHALDALGAVEFTIWVRDIPKIIQLGAAHRHVMDALLAFSASHIAHLTTCSHVGNMALTFRGTAINGLSQAIASFSRETSDAILAASMVLSWQETNWRSWTQLMEGTASVINAMKDWQHESQFLEFIKESSTFIPEHASDRRPSPPEPADMEAFGRAQSRVQKVESYLKSKRQEAKPVQQLLTFIKAARRVPPSRTAEDQFERFRDLRTWLFWLPVRCLEETRGAADALVIIALYYTVALLAERIFTGIGAAYFGSLSMGPIEHISRRIFDLTAFHFADDLKEHQEFLRFPLETVAEFRAKFHRDTLAAAAAAAAASAWDPAQHWCPTPPYSRVAAPSPPFFEHLRQQQAQGLSVYGENDPPSFSYSTEDLSPGATGPSESAPPSAVSPLSLSSPFPGQRQYLGIPSPSYPAAAAVTHSPASTTFDGTVSDSEEYGLFDVASFAAGSPAYATASPPFIAGSPAYATASPPFIAGSPAYATASPPFITASPAYATASPPFITGSPTCDAAVVYEVPPPVHDDRLYGRGRFGGHSPAQSCSTTPQYPPPEDPSAFYSLSPAGSLSLYPQTNQHLMLPLPESPISCSTPGHRRHHSSTSSIPIYQLSLEEQASPTEMAR